MKRLEGTGVKSVRHQKSLSDEQGNWYSFTLADEYCRNSVYASVRVREEQGRTHVTLLTLLYNCPTANDAAVQEQYDRVVAPLRE